MAELHGVETIEAKSGALSVTTIPTAIIGLVGTAPHASEGQAASVSVGSLLLDNMVTFVANAPGRMGNNLRITAYAATPAPDIAQAVPTSAVVGESGIIITLGCDGAGIVTATSADVITAVNALEKSPLCAVDNAGTGIVHPFFTMLDGGFDEPFPLNTPVAVAGTALKRQLGAAGTLAAALDDINDQKTALVVVVRVQAIADPVKQRGAVLAGIQSLSSSKSITGYQPRVLIATGFSEDDAVAKELETAANKLRAVAYVDCASMATAQDVIQRRQSYGARTELLRPRVRVASASGENVIRPYSARAAGLRARIDLELGWWWSKSNQEIMNILGMEQVDEFIIGDPTCQANQLNMENISTIIRRDGFRHWGNRLCASDTQWRFESVRRTADVIEDSIQETVLQYNDRPLDRDIADDIISTINSYMRTLVGLRAIFGGSAWLNAELNTAKSLAAGVIYIDYDFGPKSPTERITLNVKINNQYGVEALTA